MPLTYQTNGPNDSSDRPALTREEYKVLGRALFEEKERLRQEGESWEELSESEISYWISGARACVHALKELIKSRASHGNTHDGSPQVRAF